MKKFCVCLFYLLYGILIAPLIGVLAMIVFPVNLVAYNLRKGSKNEG